MYTRAHMNTYIFIYKNEYIHIYVHILVIYLINAMYGPWSPSEK